MLLTIHNLSDTTATATVSVVPSRLHARKHDRDSHTGDRQLQIPSASTTSTDLQKGRKHVFVLRRPPPQSPVIPKNQAGPAPLALQEDDGSTQPEEIRVKLKGRNQKLWQAADAAGDFPWIVYSRQVSKDNRTLYILSRRNMASFLSTLPDKLPLSSLLLPGTHESMAFYGWPFSQCQAMSSRLSRQLNDGIRIIDLRLAVIPSPGPLATTLNPAINYTLMTYHGIMPQNTNFLSVLSDLHTFLTSPTGKRETVVVSIKQEDFSSTPPPLFSQLVRKVMAGGPGGWDDSKPSPSGVNRGMWFLENRIPTLGEARGKVIMLSRFGGNGAGWERNLEGMGIHPTTWPDSGKEGFQWELKGTRVRTQDWYSIPSFFDIPEKAQRCIQNLIPPAGRVPTLSISFFSAATIPWALPPIVAKGLSFGPFGIQGVNDILSSWLLSKLGGDALQAAASEDTGEKQAPSAGGTAAKQEPRIRGWAMLDFYSEPASANLIPLLVECNFRGRVVGEEGL